MNIAWSNSLEKVGFFEGVYVEFKFLKTVLCHVLSKTFVSLTNKI